MTDSAPGRVGGGADLRMVPPAAAVWLGTWFGTSGLASLGWAALTAPVVGGLLLAAAVAVLAVRHRGPTVLAAALLAALGLVSGWLHTVPQATGPVASLARDEAVVRFRLVVGVDPQLRTGDGPGRGAYVVVRGRLVEVSGRGRTWRTRTPVLVIATGDQERWRGVAVGSTVAALGRLAAPDAGSDVAGLLTVRGPPETVAAPSAPLVLAERVRQGLRDAVAARPPEPRALVPALVVGDTSAVTPELQRDFATTGLTHLTAVSGANLTLLLAFLLPLARWLGVRGWWLRVVGLASVLVFVALCRAEPSVLRAAAMGLVALAALGTGGRRAGTRHLAVAATVLLLLDPFLSRSVGFALSVLASAGIVWWSRRWSEALSRWLPPVVAEAVSVPLAASLITIAVVAAISGQVSVSGLLANALAGPAVGPATVLGFLAAGLSLVHPAIAAVPGWGASWCAQWILAVAHACASLPGSAWRWPAQPFALAVLGSGALLAAAVAHHVLCRWWLSLLLSAMMVAGLLSGPVQPGWPPRDWVVVGCDVGQGDGLAVRTGPGEAMLFDAGPDPGAIDTCLDQLGVRRLSMVVLTHFHADHVDGLSGAVLDRSVGPILISPLASPAAEAAGVATLARSIGAQLRTPQLGEQGRTGSASWVVLGPMGTPPIDPTGSTAASSSPESSAENDASLVLMVEVDGLRILFTGDVEPDGQQQILSSGADLRADVLKVPHHGSARQDPAFVAATHARLAIASAGVDNDYGHPAPRTLALLQSLGVTVLRTDQQGSVAVTESARGLGAVSQR